MLQLENSVEPSIVAIGGLTKRYGSFTAVSTAEYAVNCARGVHKKLALVCAMLHEPRVLILDEPTSGLDPIATHRLNELLLEKVDGGTTVLLSSHLLDQVQKLCDRMAIM